jgi:NADH-ubiquinone oxidoreductase chain 5
MIITGSVGLFSLEYMSFDILYNRFFYILKLFVLSMVILLIVPHYIFFLIGWDGLGFSSFLLISYYNSSLAWSSRLKTFLINRLGDALILSAGVYFLYQGHYWFFFQEIRNYIIFIILGGLLTKSAHIPFSSWLPAAMAAPTPVSALVHSSTLVTAGLYIIIQLTFFFSSIVLKILVFLGLITVYYGCFRALFNFDSKKVVAYSTLRKLGLMGVAIGCGLVGLAFFHLLMHGVSKALLFIRIGQIMINCKHNQDLRKFHFSFWSNFVSFIKLFWSVCSLMGLFFLSCFYRKDIILEQIQRITTFKKLFYLLFIISFFLTFIYSVRLIGFFFNYKNTIFNFFFSSSIPQILIFSSFFLFLTTLLVGLHQKDQILYFCNSFYFLKSIIILLLIFSFFFLYINQNFKLFIHFFHYFKRSIFYIIKSKFFLLRQNMDSGFFSFYKVLTNKKKVLKNIKFSYKNFISLFQGSSFFFFFFSLLLIIIFFLF